MPRSWGSKHVVLTVFLVLWVVTVVGGFYFIVLDGTAVNKVIDFESKTFQTVGDTFVPGETVRVKASFCKYRSITPYVNSVLVDTVQTFYKEYRQSSLLIGCKQDYVFDFEPLPLDTYPQKYHFERELRYPVNPLRDFFNPIIIHIETNEFTVVTKK